MKIAVLWTYLSGYFDACLRALAAKSGVDLLVAYQLPETDAPYDTRHHEWIENPFAYRGAADVTALMARLDRFGPQALLVCSWQIKAYRQALKRIGPGALRILGMDNQWLGTPKQWLGVATARWYLRPLYDRVFLPGERQADFARRLGFRDHEIWRGLYCCDHKSFAAMFERRVAATPPHRFVYAGRLAAEKGLSILIDSYRRYRASAQAAWPLMICGAGPLTMSLKAEPGIEMMGFVQPAQLPQHFAEASCLVLPSLFEPWGVVIHEATSAGLAVICTAACGASDDLVHHSHNGYVVETGNAGELASAMSDYHALSDEHRHDMSIRSHRLASRYTPERWAADFLANVEEAL